MMQTLIDDCCFHPPKKSDDKINIWLLMMAMAINKKMNYELIERKKKILKFIVENFLKRCFLNDYKRKKWLIVFDSFH